MDRSHQRSWPQSIVPVLKGRGGRLLFESGVDRDGQFRQVRFQARDDGDAHCIGGVEKRCGGKLGVGDHVACKARTEMAHRPCQYRLACGIFAVARPIRLGVERQGDAGADHADHHEVVEPASDVALGMVDGMTQRAGRFGGAARAGAIDGQADKGCLVVSVRPTPP